MQKPAYHEKSVPPPAAPIEYAGQWVAWDKSRTRIVAHGADLVTAHRTAVANGHPEAIMQRVRHPGVGFIGFA